MRIRTIDIDAEVEVVLRAAKVDGDNLILQGQLSRELYGKTMKVAEAIGFKWNRKLKCHVGEPGAAAKLVEALNVGACVDEKKTFQFYETPERLAGRMASLAEIKPGHRVMEPSAGRGAIIRAIQQECPKLGVVFACEMNPEMASLLADRDAEEYERARTGGNYRQVIVSCGDFLQVNEKYDRIVMNPPFNGGRDIEHVLHAYDLLSPGGRLVAITSPSWKFNTSKRMRWFREWYSKLQEEGLASVPEELPEGTFKDTGTNIKALLLIALKPNDAKN
jgi:tRNA A58 N-methylase Trm61